MSITGTHLPAIPEPPARTLSPMPPRPPDPYEAYLNRFDGQASKRVMAECLDRLAQMIIELERGEPYPPDHPRISGAGCAWWTLTRERVLQLRDRLVSPGLGWAPAYINKHLSALRGVLEESWRLGLMVTDDYLRAKDVKNVKGKRVMAGRSIHAGEMAAMLASCAALEDPLRSRDSAMLVLLEATGMRREEITEALIENYDHRERELVIIGKGNKQRKAWVHKDAVPHLDRWLALVGARAGPIFRAVDRWGNIKPHGVSVDVVSDRVEYHRKRAGIAPLSPHDFRRTLIGGLYDAGGDSQQARKIAGHEQSATTDKYDRRGDRGLRDLIDRVPIVVPASIGSPS